MRPRHPSARHPHGRAWALGGLLAIFVGVTLMGSCSAQAATGWQPGGPLPGLGNGRIWSLAVSPQNPSMVVAGTDNGIYRSTDAGVTWSGTVLHGIRVWTVGFDVRDLRTVFAGTDGQGVRRSVDGGSTWVDVSSGLTSLTVRSLAFGYAGIAAGTAHGVAVTSDGLHWRKAGLDSLGIASVAVAANSPRLTLIAGADQGDLSNGYLFRDSTGGSSWSVLQEGLPAPQTPANPARVVVASVAAGPLSQSVPQRPLVVATNRGAFASGDGGTNWSLSQGLPDTITLTTVAISPLNPNLVYAGADAGGSSGGALMRSVDAGTTFTDAAAGLPDKTREVSALAVAATNPPLVLAALNPPSGGGAIFREADTTAPPPATIVPEAPGAPLPSLAPTPTAAPSINGPGQPAPPPPPPGLIARAAGAVFHWPQPLLYEVIGALLAAYVVVRWRQRYLDVEGPP